MFQFASTKLNTRFITPCEITAGDITGSSKLLVPGRVTSATSIPQGAMSMPIKAENLRGQPDVMQISVGVNSFGTIELEGSSRSTWFKDIHWIRALRLADDCHSYNVQLRLLSSPKQSTSSSSISEPTLLLQSVRPISPGQELLLWFSEEILAMLQVVFLTPANIQGQKKYVCIKCLTMYESPNPLKLHVTLACGAHPISWLWNKLSMLNCGTSNRDFNVKEFSFNLLPDLLVTKQRNAIDLSVGTSNSVVSQNPANKLYRPFVAETHNSAFKPFQKRNNKEDENASVQSRCPYQPWPNFSLTEGLVSTPIKFENRCEDEAQIETLVSSLGKSKHGHICLYCGKRYSRKYGLKIHIRTHTGYKPLKCKYCLRPFGDPSNLNKHVRLHAAGDTPYKCDLCGKVLVRRRDLERHLKSRHMADIHPEGSSLNIKEEVLDISDEEKNVYVN
ncbi:hypothetical protein Trydic_g8389 [Trypoxylus dichotomus]